ncbi:hypothetical protein PVAG01_02188 [Phlyctema vagabunda]|uniref:Zn(2)-C6 fungal-type domain-containing protein n=1 Tax=Phlyctema vagabunda TaxID=108571 RepID=A0ABR4PPW8_9HELO
MVTAKERPQAKISRRRGACRRCKEKKRRCDGKRPNCSNCESSFHLNRRCECVYDTEIGNTSSPSPKSVEPPPPQLNTSISSHLPTCLPTQNVAETVEKSYLQTYITDQWEVREPLIFDSENFDHSSHDQFKQFLAFESYEDDSGDFDSANQAFSGSEGLSTPLASSDSERTFWQSSDKMIYDSSTFFPSDQSSSLLQSLFPSSSSHNKDGAAADLEDGSSQELLCEDSAISSIIAHHSIVNDVRDTQDKYRLQELLLRISFKLKTLQSKREAEPLSGISLPLPQVFDIQSIRRHVNAFVNNTLSSFIIHEHIDEILIRYMGQDPSAEEAVVPLVHALAALGCRAVEDSERTQADIPYTISSNLYFEAAMASSRGLLLGKPSIMKIQALIAMSLFCEGLDKPELHASLVANAVQLVLSMRLNSIKSIKNIAKSPQEENLLQRIFWIVYSMEKPAVMRLGRSSAIDDDSIDYPPGPHLAKGCLNTNDFLLLERSWSYAKVCSTIKKCLYGVSLVHSRAELSDAFLFLETIANDWKDSLTDTRVDPRNIEKTSSPALLSDIDGLSKLKQTLHYHEAILIIYQSGSKCLKPSRAILDSISSLQYLEKKPDLSTIMLSCMAFVNIAIDAIAHPNSVESSQNMAYLGIGLGLFGRLAAEAGPDEVPFAELGELFCVSQRLLNNNA